MTSDVEPGEFVQILHNGAGHWVTISIIGQEHPEVQVFDSPYDMQSKKIAGIYIHCTHHLKTSY